MDESGSSLHHEDLLILLRSRLNEQKVKLWEPPYSDDPSAMQELAQKYSQHLNRDCNAVLHGLQELQTHAISRLKANSLFKESGLATFRVRAPSSDNGMRQFNIECKVDVTGSQLISLIAAEIPVPENRLKLIINGVVVTPEKLLQNQGFKNGAQVLALVMSESPEQLVTQDGLYQAMRTTRDDAELLMNADSDSFNSGSDYMKLEDQCGNAISLPESERRALMVGLALHEHGRTAMRKGDYTLALVLLLEADRHFSECSASVLKTVDNWALLQLDVAWCYLCLESLSSAADADIRLKRAETALVNSYGEKMERLIALKGTDANESLLMMRLHLLQAIAAYHQNQRDRARILLEKAERELDVLRVNESDVLALVELGWSEAQARTGLRACVGSPDRAHDYLTQLVEKRDRARRQAKEERLRRSLGVCLDGTPVSREFVRLLVGMGFPRRLAVAALQNSNNHVSEAVRIIQEQPELLTSAMETSDSLSSLDNVDSSTDVDEAAVARLVSLGYEQAAVEAALQQHDNDIDAALDLLTRSVSLPGGDSNAGASSSKGCSSAEKKGKKQVLQKTIEEEKQKKKKREEALERLNSAIGKVDDDHLDSTLQQEEAFLARYKSLLM